MRRVLTVATAVLVFVLAMAMASTALAASVHFKKGSPQFADQGSCSTPPEPWLGSATGTS
jgi:hypothetical protein